MLSVHGRNWLSSKSSSLARETDITDDVSTSERVKSICSSRYNIATSRFSMYIELALLSFLKSAQKSSPAVLARL